VFGQTDKRLFRAADVESAAGFAAQDVDERHTATIMVDLVGFEPTTSSMPWNSKNRNLLTEKALKVGRVGKNR
jgi:hypothetical protein